VSGQRVDGVSVPSVAPHDPALPIKSGTIAGCESEGGVSWPHARDCGAQQILRLVAQLVEIRANGKVRHDETPSLPAVRVPGVTEIVSNVTFVPGEVDSVPPADPAAPSH
jgi:hypothetical protein